MTASKSTRLFTTPRNGQTPVQRMPAWWPHGVAVCLLILTITTGCKKTEPETPPKPEAAATTPKESSPPEVPKPTAEPTAADSESEQPTADNDGRSAAPAGGSSAESKSDGASGEPSSANSGVKVSSGTGPIKNGKSGGKSGSSSTKPQTAEAALEQARGLHEKSAASAKLLKYGAAYDLASQAWEAVHAFPDDPQCKSLASQLETELESLGDRANALATPGDDKRLIDQ